MIVLLGTWVWLMIGCVLGRIVFVRILGDAPRRDHRHPLKRYAWTGTFTRAVWTGIACAVAWPVALPVTLMLAQTGAEKLRARREQLETEVAELEKNLRLVRRHGGSDE